MSASLQVEELNPGEYPAWSTLVTGSPDGSPYALPEYLEALTSAAGGWFTILGARRGEELVGGLPLYLRRSRYGITADGRLLLYYHGPVLRRFPSKYPSQRTAREIELLGALADALAGSGYAKVVLKPRHTLCDVRPFQQRGWRVRPSYSYQVSLGDLPAQWQRVEQNFRRLVDRAEGEGIRFCEDEDFESFLRLHRITMQHHDAQSYLPDESFRRWFARLRTVGLCRLYHARQSDGRAVASQLVLVSGHPVTHTVSAASDPEFHKTGASAFLRWKALEHLAGLGFEGNDLTDASLNPVTHFKSQLGGDLVVNHIIESPGTGRWRVGTVMERVFKGARARLGGLLGRRPGPA